MIEVTGSVGRWTRRVLRGVAAALSAREARRQRAQDRRDDVQAREIARWLASGRD